ncbi:hypothetical protein K1719_006738 [Acacia pycnantha]|nr:hypothetical protein K1719_006738 [Acacia pycnantha]
MLVAIMRTYDPPTNQFRIRGKTLEIQGEDVSQLLGVPRCGEEVTMNVSDTDPILLQLRKDYGKMKYDDILNVITSGESGDQFEILFMMHMLGTFLAPTSSITPSMQLLKVLKDLYANLMGIINDGHKKLVASVEDELRKAQTYIERQWKQQVGEEDDGEDSQDGHDYEAQEGHRDGHHDDDGHHGSELVMRMMLIRMTHLLEHRSTLMNLMYPVQQEDAAPRRSMRAKKPKIKSPWILTKPLKRARKAKEDKEEKEILFDIISGPYTEDERQQILIQRDDEDITREQLQTLGRRNRLSNRVMSVVCKTLMLDMKRDMKREGQSQVRRHIFSADQMNLLNIKPVGWKVSEWKQQLLPQYIGYNMCDCDLIMGPMLVLEHWFRMAIDPSTMNFYVLDSMNTKVYLSKNQASNKKKTAGASPQAKAIAKISDGTTPSSPLSVISSSVSCYCEASTFLLRIAIGTQRSSDPSHSWLFSSTVCLSRPRMAYRFWAQGGNDSEEESDYDDVVRNPVGKPTNETAKSRYFKVSDTEPEPEPEPTRVVRPAKDKRFEEMSSTIDQMRNAMKINDWVSLQESFDKINKQLEKVMRITESEKVPTLYIKALVTLEDFLAQALANKDAKKKMSSSNAKALNSMKQKSKKNKQYEDLITKYRENPESETDESVEEVIEVIEEIQEIPKPDETDIPCDPKLRQFMKKPSEISWDMVNKKFKEVVAARGWLLGAGGEMEGLSRLSSLPS